MQGTDPAQPQNRDTQPQGSGFFFHLVRNYHRFSLVIIIFWVCVVGVGAWALPQCLENFNSTVRISLLFLFYKDSASLTFAHARNFTHLCSRTKSIFSLQMKAVKGSESDIARNKLDIAFPQQSAFEVDVVSATASTSRK
jgi:hypothetical protein